MLKAERTNSYRTDSLMDRLEPSIFGRAYERNASTTTIEVSFAQLSASKLEYSASELRKLLQELFPHRRLVLSQFTFYNQIGVAKPTGDTFRRKRRCYRLVDILPIACVLSLKEQGIPLKNIGEVPGLIHQFAETIFQIGSGCRLTGTADSVHLHIPGSTDPDLTLAGFLEGSSTGLFWGFDVGELANQICNVAARVSSQQLQQAA